MNITLSDRISKPDFQGGFTATILKAAADPSIISFAGGLPNGESFPIAEMEAAAKKVLETNGVLALQYNSTQGYLPLRQWIADRYLKTQELDVSPDEIIITNGSQQALEMLGHALINPGDEVIVENPTYLVALQSLHLYDPKVIAVDLTDKGIDTDELAKAVKEHNPKLMYVIPNFQNPTGLTYAEATRKKVAEIVKGTDILVVEDNPYGELRFSGKAGHSFRYFLDDQCAMLGTFSKIAAPGMRLGWVVIKNPGLRAALLNYKSTLDLHTNIFSQVILHQYLMDNDLDAHIEECKELYGKKAEYMIECIEKYFPKGVKYTHPEGGMFMWATLPNGIKAVDVYYAAIERGVAVCPGDPFYEYDRDVSTMRLNYSNSTDEQIELGIKTLGEVMAQFVK